MNVYNASVIELYILPVLYANSISIYLCQYTLIYLFFIYLYC